jgi:hypothetical protein
VAAASPSIGRDVILPPPLDQPRVRSNAHAVRVESAPKDGAAGPHDTPAVSGSSTDARELGGEPRAAVQTVEKAAASSTAQLTKGGLPEGGHVDGRGDPGPPASSALSRSAAAGVGSDAVAAAATADGNGRGVLPDTSAASPTMTESPGHGHEGSGGAEASTNDRSSSSRTAGGSADGGGASRENSDTPVASPSEGVQIDTASNSDVSLSADSPAGVAQEPIMSGNSASDGGASTPPDTSAAAASPTVDVGVQVVPQPDEDTRARSSDGSSESGGGTGSSVALDGLDNGAAVDAGQPADAVVAVEGDASAEGLSAPAESDGGDGADDQEMSCVPPVLRYRMLITKLTHLTPRCVCKYLCLSANLHVPPSRSTLSPRHIHHTPRLLTIIF